MKEGTPLNQNRNDKKTPSLLASNFFLVRRKDERKQDILHAMWESQILNLKATLFCLKKYNPGI